MGTFSAVVTLLNEIFTLGARVWILFRDAKINGWVKDGRALSLIISEAKTNEDRAALAKRLFEHRVG